MTQGDPTARTTGHWITALDLDEAHCVTFVRDMDEREALIRLGAPPEAIRPMTFDEARRLTFAGVLRTLGSCAVANRFGDWIVLVEQNGAEGVDPVRVRVLSAGAELVASYVSVNYDQRFVYARDGVILADYDEGRPTYGNGADMSVLEPYIEQVGRHRFTNDDEPDDSPEGAELERADLSLACAISGVHPAPEDFDGQLLGAAWVTPRMARFQTGLAEALAQHRTAQANGGAAG